MRGGGYSPRVQRKRNEESQGDCESTRSSQFPNPALERAARGAMSNIYGGDEVNALVVDVGTHSCKAGYAGDDIPKAVFPSSCGVLINEDGMEVDGGKPGRKIFAGHSGVNFRRDGMEVISPFGDDDLLSDWDMVESLWEHTFKDRLRVNPAEYAIMLAEATNNTKEVREKTVELMFEKFNVPALFMARNAALSSFATARQTALVVDAGHRSTTVAAVLDGYVLLKSVMKSAVGGQTLTKCMLRGMETKLPNIRPSFTFKRVDKGMGEFQVDEIPGLEKTTESFKSYQVDQIAADVKESICRVSDGLFNEAENANIPTVSYELPDGTEISVGPDRFKVPEVYFQPQLLATWGSPELEALKGTPRLQDMIMDSINHCDLDVRKELYSGAILTGGSALLSGLRDRVEREMVEVGPQTAKIKVVMPVNNLERRFSVWIGGSILASLGSFQQMWMSKKEYEESGAGLIARKAP
eukprot:gene24042-9619_t